MASSSTSSVPKSFKYDVFLSFRGEDTRKSFVDHLYHALEGENIETYKDDEKMVKGERICDELINAIEDSRFYIIVFSKSYASSSWCLDELVKIMECLQGTTEQKAYPVFYDVEPTEVRKQSGAVAEAFARRRMDKDAGKWRKALEEAAGLAGFGLKNTANGHEAQFIQEIVKVISHELNSISFMVDEKLVGMETRIKGIISSLELGFVDVRMLGIKGMGGGGKTTLARAVFDQISHQFEGKSFVENVREVSKSSLSGLKSLQEKILSNVLGKQIDVNDVHDGKKMMKRKLCGRKVLVVLDDVDLLEQLEALAGESNWFKSGSRIIITTRDEQVLIAHEVTSIRDVNLLSNEEAICLFNRFAFRIGEIPSPRFKELSQQVVRYAAGLPLTIRVLGSNLKGKDEDEWKDTLESLKKIPLEETLQKLELSFMGLQRDHKDIFLDVVCFWKGEKKDDAIIGLESCQLHAKAGLSVLERKSLITVSEYGRLEMHDSIQEMGWDIVRRDHRDEPQSRSRLWDTKEIKDVLANDLGSEATRGIKLWWSNLNPSIIMKGLKNMKKLRFLHVHTTVGAFGMDYNDGSNGDGTNDEVSQYFPNALQYLYWFGYPFSSLPITFEASNLVGLDMSNSNLVQLWEGGERKVLKKLRFFEFRGSCLKTLDLGITPILEKLSIDCPSFEKLHMPADRSKLKSFIIKDLKLKTLDLEGASNLETLNLKDCLHLVELHMPSNCPKLKSLDIGRSKLTTLDLKGTSNLEILILKDCLYLVELQMPTKFLKLKCLDIESCLRLTTLNLWGTPNINMLILTKCENLVELHMPAESLKLESFDITHSKMTTLNLGATPNLKKLSLQGCENLAKLVMPTECRPKLEYLRIKNSELTTLDLGGNSNLEKLILYGCFHLEQLHMPAESLKLESFDIRHSKMTTLNLGATPNLKKLSLQGCENLAKLVMPTECRPKLESLCIENSELTTLDLGGTSNLEKLILYGCIHLVQLQMPATCLKLKSLGMRYCLKLTTLDLEGASYLETLSLQQCSNLVELHMPSECVNLKSFDIRRSKLTTLHLEGASYLETLSLQQCSNLVELQMPSECVKLKSFDIRRSKLTTLDLKGASNIETLSLQECYNLVELHMPSECLKLKSLDIATLNLGGFSNIKSFDLWKTPNLKALSLEQYCDLEEDHHLSCSNWSTIDLRRTLNLKKLVIRLCDNDSKSNHDNLLKLHMPNGLPKLKSLELIHPMLRSLYLGGTPNPEGCDELDMALGCPKLQSLKIICSKLSTLKLGPSRYLETVTLLECDDLVHISFGLAPNLTSLNLSHSKLRSLDIAMTPNLENLSLMECKDLELERPLECRKLKYLYLSRCSKLKTLRLRTPNLEWLVLEECSDLVVLHMLDECPKLELMLPEDLRKLTLIGNIPEVPMVLGQLGYLEELMLSSTEIKHLPENICMLQRLKFLTLDSCHLLEKLPEDLGQLQCLEQLTLWDCKSLQDIPDNICKMKCLEYLCLRRCIAVGKLPEELGSLKCLKELDIRGTRISHLPQSIVLFQDLRIIGSELLLQSCSFTSKIQTSNYEMFYYRGTHSRSLLCRY